MSIRRRTTIKYLQKEIDAKIAQYNYKDEYLYRYHDTRWIDSAGYVPDNFKKIFIAKSFFDRKCFFGICVNESPIVIEAGMSLPISNANRHWYITVTHSSAKSCGYFNKEMFYEIRKSYMPYASDDDKKCLEFISNCIDKHLCQSSGNIINDGIENFINDIPVMGDNPSEDLTEQIEMYCGHTLKFTDMMKLYGKERHDIIDIAKEIMKNNEDFNKHVRDNVDEEHVTKIHEIQQQIKEMPVKYIFKENLK